MISICIDAPCGSLWANVSALHLWLELWHFSGGWPQRVSGGGWGRAAQGCAYLVTYIYLEMQTYNFFWTYSKRTKKSFIRHIRVLTGFTGCPKKMARLIPRNGHAKFDLLSTGQKDFGIIISNCGYWISMLIFHGTAALGFIRFSP